MAISRFQQKVLEEEFASVLDTFKGREIDEGGQLKKEVERALRKKLAEIVSYEPAFAGFTVTVTQDRILSDRFIFDVHRPNQFVEVPQGAARRPS